MAVSFSGEIKWPASSIITWRSASGSLDIAMQAFVLDASDNALMLSKDVGFGVEN